MKSTERMAKLFIQRHGEVLTHHGPKTRDQLALMIEEVTGIEKLAQSIDTLIRVLNSVEDAKGYAPEVIFAIAKARAAVQHYRGDDDDK